MRAQLVGAVILAMAGVLPAAAADKELAAIHAVDNSWLKGFAAGDGEAMSRLYAENAVLMPPNAPPVSGRAAIRDFLGKEAQGAAKAGMVFSFGDQRDGGSSGKLGWSSGTYVVKDKSGKVVESGKFLSVSKKVNGQWLYLRDTWNADSAPPK